MSEQTTPPRTEKPRKPKKTGPDWLQRVTRLKPGIARRLIIVVVFIALFLGIGSGVSKLVTNYWWFKEVGHTEVFWTPIIARICVGLFFAVIFFILFYGSLLLARKISPRLLPVSESTEGETNVFEWATKQRWTGRIVLLIAVVIAIIFGISYGGRWEDVLLFLNKADFGYADPQFGKDASFYVYTLPVWSMLVNFVGVTMLFTFLATAFTYVVDRALVLNEKNRVRLAPHVKAHLSAIMAIAMVAKAADYMLQTWELNFSTRGVTFGASYTDVHASLPVLHFLAIVSLFAAAIFLLNIRFRGWRLPAIAIVIMFLTWAIAGKAYPAIVQSYRVNPNEIAVEREYISRNIETTRWAFEVDDVKRAQLEASSDLTADAVKANSGTTDNVRIWEPRPALDTYSQIQEIRLYYSFVDVDVDRYMIDGKYRQVLISGRELDQTQLQAESQRWVNKHLTYTHGYGFVMSPVNEASGDGLPRLMVSNIPPTTATDLKITRPEIYYGELGNPFVVVNTKEQEFDYPQGDSNVYTTYKGQGGVPIGNQARRLAFAFRFGDLSLFFSGALTGDSRIMYNRTIQERVDALAQFLAFDRDPYLVLRDDGTLVWLWDAYTTTDRFPYSQPLDSGSNYVRNSVKVVIDAFNGNVTLYQIDKEDAIANTWGKVYDGLFTPGDQMPEDLKRHWRYPEDMFTIQASVLSTYHMTDPQIFYNKEDVWEIPRETYDSSQSVEMVPFYEVLTLPGQSQPEFALVRPFVPLSKQNMASLMVARQDGESYGELLLVDFPKNKLVYGPTQMEARISNDPVISSQLTLWDQAGSRVIRGNLLVVPIDQAIVYFEPVYLQAEQSPIPELTRVIAAYGDNIVMEPSLTEALSKLFGADFGETTSTTGGNTTTTTGSTTTTIPPSTTTTVPVQTTTTIGGPTTTIPADVNALVELANQHYEAAIAAQKAGDWATYGAEIQALGKVLEALAALR